MTELVEVRSDGKRPYEGFFCTDAELLLSFSFFIWSKLSFSPSSIIVTGRDGLTGSEAMFFPLPFSAPTQFSCTTGSVNPAGGAEFVLLGRTEKCSGERAEASTLGTPPGLEFARRCS
jgi:hypothetical protein